MHEKLLFNIFKARSILKIPVPEVLAWSGEVNNPVGSEYILMREATGTALHEVWGELELEDKLDIVHEVVAIEKKLLSISFTLLVSIPLLSTCKTCHEFTLIHSNRYGSLYYATDAFCGCEKAQVYGDIEQSQKE